MNTPVRNEYPRPDRVRDSWITLNGQWDFTFDKNDTGLKEKWFRRPVCDKKIEVPFAYQSMLSGIGSTEHSDVVWYSRTFSVPSSMKDRVLLHFGAVDYKADVWIDGCYLGGHEGGYTPFTFDITNIDALYEKEHMLTIRCEDRLDCEQPRGKQSYRPEPFACWYTPVTGIWQSVWLEGVGCIYPVDIRLTPCVERASVKAEIRLNRTAPGTKLRLTAMFDGAVAAQQELTVLNERTIYTDMYLTHGAEIEGVYMWSPEHPNLYDLIIETISDGNVCDKVKTYFGMRSICVSGSHILLNGRTLFQRLILDQGYWPDGILTAPDADALKKDVELTLAMGYNGARKHQKFEDPIYLYWADKLGLMVWEELPSPYKFSDTEKRNMLRDLSEAVARDYNHPCTIAWTPINESWGVNYIQYDKDAQRLADMLYYMLKSLDGTRIVSGNDGWEQTSTDIVTVHDYTALPEQLSTAYSNVLTGNPGGDRIITANGYDNSGKPMLLTEYGGIAMQKDNVGNNWGYNGAVADEDAFIERFAAITKVFANMPGFSGYCYTQLTDVFQEVNGLLDMNRQPKATLARIREANLCRHN